MQKSLKLIHYDVTTRKYSVVAETLRELQSKKGFFYGIAFCGLSRGGKSAFLNFIAAYGSNDVEQHFVVSNNTDPCTIGVWIYFVTANIDGAERLIVLIDTEGTARGDDTVTAHLCAAAALLASTMVYNTTTTFNNYSLDTLGVCTSIMKEIPDIGCDIDIKPHLIVLVRDATLKCTIEGKPVSHKEYIQHQFKVGKNDNKDSTRKAITDCFRSVDMLTTATPVEAEFHNLFTHPYNKKFIDSITEARNTLLRSVAPKSMGGVQVTASDLPVEAIVAGLNGSEIKIDSLIDIVHHRGCERNRVEATEKYCSLMNQRDSDAVARQHGQANDAHTNLAHTQSLQETIAQFDAGVRTAPPEISAPVRQALTTSLQDRLAVRLQRNAAIRAQIDAENARVAAAEAERRRKEAEKMRQVAEYNRKRTESRRVQYRHKPNCRMERGSRRYLGLFGPRDRLGWNCGGTDEGCEPYFTFTMAEWNDSMYANV